MMQVPGAGPGAAFQSSATEAEVTEWTKMFKMADADGSGQLDRMELRRMMEDLRRDPSGATQYTQVSDEEIARIIGEMDRDGNNAIDLGEFLIGMELFARRASSVTGTRNSATFDDSSSLDSRITSSASSFFSQFERFDPNHADRWLPKVLKRLNREEADGGDPAEDIDIFYLTGRCPDVRNPKQKVAGLKFLATMMVPPQAQLNQFAMILRQVAHLQHLQLAVKNICQIVRSVEWFPTTQDRLDVYPFLVGVFDFMSNFQVMQLLAHRCLRPDPNVDPLQGANLAYQALEVIYHYIPGPGISTLRQGHPWHYAAMKSQGEANQFNLIMNFVVPVADLYMQAYQSGRLYSERVVEMAIRVLGAYASVNQAPQQLMILSPICDWLVGLIQARQAPNIVASVTWTLAILCGETHGESCVDVQAQGTSHFQHLQTKGVVTKLFYLLSTLQAANQRGQVVPECFDPSFVSIHFPIEDQPCLMQQDAEKGLKYYSNQQRFCLSNMCACFYHLLPALLSNGGAWMQTPAGREFGNQILWILGTSVGYLLKRVRSRKLRLWVVV
jgi:Ca2+-binding EF-hand superfamily protein